MDKQTITQFMSAKLKALHGFPSPSYLNTVARIVKGYEEGRFTLAQLKMTEAELDSAVRTATRPGHRLPDLSALRKEFGFTSLSKTPDVVAKAILKRGKVKNVEEADIMDTWFSEVDSPPRVLSEDEIKKLCTIIRDWNYATGVIRSPRP